MYKLHNNILIVGLLAIGFLTVIMSSRALCMMTIVTIFAFVTQLLLILNFAKDPKAKYSSQTLFWTVLIYSMIMGSLFMVVSYYYDGDTFLFSKRDALFYFNSGLRAVDFGYLNNARSIISKYDSEEWGGLLTISLIVYILPNKLFLNFVYMLLGAVSSVMLFRISKHFMSNSYAFCAALSYGASSYAILFHCTSLKESIFVFFVIASMYYFYRAAVDKNYWSYIGMFLCLVAVVFFRPAVTAFLAVSFVAYFAITQRGSAVSIFLFVIIAVGMVASLSFMQAQVDTYTVGDIDGKIEKSAHDNYSGSFNNFVNWFAAPFGPFPSLFPKTNCPPSTINFYGAGLLYRLFLIVPFWVGVFYVIKRRNIKLIPVTLFILVEMLATAYVLASIELRKVLPHVPFMSVLMFYGLYRLSKIESNPFVKILMGPVSYGLVFGVLILWNVIKVKG